MNLALEQIRRMKAYMPPIEKRSQFNGLRLDFNERLAPLPNTVVEAIRGFDPQRSLMYPAYGSLVQKIAGYLGVGPERVMLSNGSDQGMEIIFRTYIGSGDRVVIPSPSFAMFYQVAEIQGAEIVKPSYGNDGAFPIDEVFQILEGAVKMLIICNPNNPTGNLLSLGEIEKILKAADNTLVYIDEAYFEFSGVSAVSLIDKYPNLIVSRTFSKAFGLAALRVGYLVSSEANISEMLKVRGPYDVNQVAAAAASAALDSLADTRQYCDEVMGEAKPFVESCFRDLGIDFFPSRANFIYFKEPFKGFPERLKQSGILIRPRSDGYARVSIGTLQQMQKFAEILTQITE